MKTILSAFISACLLGQGVFAHSDATHYPVGQDVTVKVTKVNGNVYMLQGRGGNIGALTGPEGILMIDDDYKVVSEKLRDALKDLGSPSPRFIINTHWHGDHTEGNEFFGKGSTIVAHVNVRKRLMDPPTIFGQKTAPYSSYALPMITYTESMSMHLNGEDIKIVYFPSGHTDGDSVIYFTRSNVVHLGDDFFVGAFPFVDIDSGGSVQGLIKNVGTLIDTLPPDAKLIPGHGPLATVDDLKAFRQLLVETTDIIQKEMKAGKTLDQIKAAGLPDKYKKAGEGFIKTPNWIDIVYRSYSQK
jgi:glyoxylase-like metal-dependent hydrolase (beta-lactamase superfamily II)